MTITRDETVTVTWTHDYSSHEWTGTADTLMLGPLELDLERIYPVNRMFERDTSRPHEWVVVIVDDHQHRHLMALRKRINRALKAAYGKGVDEARRVVTRELSNTDHRMHLAPQGE